MTPRPAPRRGWATRLGLAAAVLALVSLLLPMITVPRAKAGILTALQTGLGRRIEADAVHLRLLPLPGVALDGVRVGEDPAFGLEDMVVADDATASLSWSALLRGRLAFARIHLDHASINLVRNRSGDWNIAALLAGGRGGRAAARSGATLAARFPYIEWSDSRINFKLEQTKTRFYLDQVAGSLAREGTGWRLQAGFQPQRTDLSLSNTGEVTLDGHWGGSLPGQGFRELPFAVELRLRNSYLAGSSALLAGHDAGVHGILSAQLQVAGTSQQFRISGTAQAQSLRRWDLLPPPATVSCAFAGSYTPGEDRFVLEGVGDPGWRHLRLQGAVTNVFTHPRADLRLSLRQFAAADLLPLAMALKAHLPRQLQAAGTADGGAHLLWTAGGALPQEGSATIRLTAFALATPQEELRLPAAELTWDGRRLRLPASRATLQPQDAAVPTSLRVAANLDHRGFAFQIDSAAFNGADAAVLSDLVGLHSPWPPRLAGSADLRLALSAPWPEFRQARWSGIAQLATAHFAPDDTPPLLLRRVRIAFGDPGPMRADFVLPVPGAGAQSAVTGTVQWSAAAAVLSPRAAAAPLRFDLRAGALPSQAIWDLLHPPPRGLVQRVLAPVLAGVTGDGVVAWARRLNGTGTLAVNDLDWHGVHAGLQLTLTAAAGQWQAPSIVLGLAGGTFRGRGRLAAGNYEISGAVAAPQALALEPLLAPTPYRGLLGGELSGSLQLVRPAEGAEVSQVAAQGDFLVRHGTLATAAGSATFDRFAGHYALDHGAATLSHIQWQANGQLWNGDGTATLGPAGRVGLHLVLRQGGRTLRIER